MALIQEDERRQTLRPGQAANSAVLSPVQAPDTVTTQRVAPPLDLGSEARTRKSACSRSRWPTVWPLPRRRGRESRLASQSFYLPSPSEWQDSNLRLPLPQSGGMAASLHPVDGRPALDPAGTPLSYYPFAGTSVVCPKRSRNSRSRVGFRGRADFSTPL